MESELIIGKNLVVFETAESFDKINLVQLTKLERDLILFRN